MIEPTVSLSALQLRAGPDHLWCSVHRSSLPRCATPRHRARYEARAARIDGGGRVGRRARGAGKYPLLHARLPRRADARHAALRARPQRRASDAASRLADMDEQGVDAQILYPTVGGQLLGASSATPSCSPPAAAPTTTGAAEYCRGRARAPALGGDAAAAGRRPGGRRGAARRRQGRRGVLRAPQSGRGTQPLPPRPLPALGGRSRRSTGRSASTTRARRTCRRTASAWTRTPPATSSRTPSRR